MVSIEVNTLKRWSADPTIESIRLNKLSVELRRREFFKNLDTYTNEVIDNQPVSLLYHYWFDQEGHLFTGPERLPIQNTINQIDPQERGGLPREGFVRLEETLLHHPGETILWYSPKGRAAFTDDKTNPYSEITYDYGQLYVQSFNGDRVNAVAIKVTNEQAVRALFQQLGLPVVEQSDESYGAIQTYLQNPCQTGLTIDELINLDLDLPMIFVDKKQRKNYYWSEISHAMRMTFAGKNNNRTVARTDETVVMLNKNSISSDDIARAYMLTILRSMDAQGISKIALSGSCGGDTIDRSDIETLLGMRRGELVIAFAELTGRPFEEIVGLHSSVFRKVTQSEPETTYEPGVCIDCNMEKDKVGDCGICTDCEKNYD